MNPKKRLQLQSAGSATTAKRPRHSFRKTKYPEYALQKRVDMCEDVHRVICANGINNWPRDLSMVVAEYAEPLRVNVFSQNGLLDGGKILNISPTTDRGVFTIIRQRVDKRFHGFIHMSSLDTQTGSGHICASIHSAGLRVRAVCVHPPSNSMYLCCSLGQLLRVALPGLELIRSDYAVCDMAFHPVLENFILAISDSGDLMRFDTVSREMKRFGILSDAQAIRAITIGDDGTVYILGVRQVYTFSVNDDVSNAGPISGVNVSEGGFFLDETTRIVSPKPGTLLVASSNGYGVTVLDVATGEFLYVLRGEFSPGDIWREFSALYVDPDTQCCYAGSKGSLYQIPLPGSCLLSLGRRHKSEF